MAQDDYFVILYAILKYLYDCLKTDQKVNWDVISNTTLKIPANYWGYILEHASKDGLIEGIKIIPTKDGTLIGNLGIRITPKGIEYLFDNNMMSKVKTTLKDIKDVVPFI